MDVKKIVNEILKDEEIKKEIISKLWKDAEYTRKHFDESIRNTKEFQKIFTDAVIKYEKKHNIKLSEFEKEEIKILLAFKSIALRNIQKV